MVARARALIPRLRDRASKTEELRRLPPETERDLHDACLFRIVQPKRVGGSELDYVALIDCADALGQADASVAWNFANLASHHWMLAMFDREAQDAVWDKDANALIASSFIFPAGRARKVDGGYVLNGHWPFSSGVESSDWNMLASVVSSDDEADGIEYRIFLLNSSEYKINDTWNATGLCGTGSNDVRVADTFVAEKMSVAVSDLTGGPTPGSNVNPNALYALPVFSLFPYVLSGVGLGNAQACLNGYVNSRGIGPRPITVPSSATCRRPRSRSLRHPPRLTRPASSCVQTASMRWPMQGVATFPICRSRPGCVGMAPFR